MPKKTEDIRCFYCGNRFTISEKAVNVDKRGDKKPYVYVRCPRCLSTRNTMYYESEKKLFAGDRKPISPQAETPFNASEGVSPGGNDLLNADDEPHVPSQSVLFSFGVQAARRKGGRR